MPNKGNGRAGVEKGEGRGVQAHVEEEGLETEVDTGARVVPVEQEDRAQMPPLPHEPCVRTL